MRCQGGVSRGGVVRGVLGVRCQGGVGGVRCQGGVSRGREALSGGVNWGVRCQGSVSWGGALSVFFLVVDVALV